MITALAFIGLLSLITLFVLEIQTFFPSRRNLINNERYQITMGVLELLVIPTFIVLALDAKDWYFLFGDVLVLTGCCASFLHRIWLGLGRLKKHAETQSGFTLVEFMIVLAIIGILGAIVAGNMGGMGCARGSKVSAEQYCADYAKEMGLTFKACSCVESDSDGDGYISCTLRASDSPDQPVTERDIECGSGSLFSTTGGCKKRLPSVQPQLSF